MQARKPSVKTRPAVVGADSGREVCDAVVESWFAAEKAIRSMRLSELVDRKSTDGSTEKKTSLEMSGSDDGDPRSMNGMNAADEDDAMDRLELDGDDLDGGAAGDAESRRVREAVMAASWEELVARGTGILAIEAAGSRPQTRAAAWAAVADRLALVRKPRRKGQDAKETEAPATMPESLAPGILDAAFSTLPRYADRTSRAAVQRAVIALARALPKVAPKIVGALDKVKSSKNIVGNGAATLSILAWSLGVVPVLASDDQVPADVLKQALSVACDVSMTLPPKIAGRSIKLARSAVSRAKINGAKRILAAALDLAKSNDIRHALPVVVCLDVAEHKKWDFISKEDREKALVFWANAVLGSKAPVSDSDQVRLPNDISSFS